MSSIPASTSETVPWRQRVRGGTIDDRRLSEIKVSIPADIAGLHLHIPAGLAAECDEAVRAVSALDTTHGGQLRPLSVMLLRAESIASSKIEHEHATVEEYARALHGVKSNQSALSMARNTGALDRLLAGPITEETIRDAHRHLMSEDPIDGAYAGSWRTVQNWIGGSDHSPRGADYIPPPPDMVAPKMADLVAWCRRDDVPVFPQSAIGHAQLEAIHPFTDGNGRIGRALASSVLRRRGITRHVTVPVAAALAARREQYFAGLRAYHSGDATPIISTYAVAARIAAEESMVTAGRLGELPTVWSDVVRARGGSAASTLLASLAAEPVFSSEDAEDRLRLPTPTVYRAIDRLRAAGVIRPLTNRTRNQVWGAVDVLDELADLEVRIVARAGGR